MKTTLKRAVLWLLCAALLVSSGGLSAVQARNVPGAAQTESTPQKCVYGKAGETTFVPAGYTYILEGEEGMIYSRFAPYDMYIAERTLTESEAEALANLEYGQEGYISTEDGTILETRDFDAKQAAAYSAAVREILGETNLQGGETISLHTASYRKDTDVRVMITFEDAPVAAIDTMEVHLGQTLGAEEQAAMQAIIRRQEAQIQSIRKSLGYDIHVTGQFSLLTNAVSATVKYGDLAKLNQLPGVKKAFLMPSFSVPELKTTTVTSGADLLPNMKYVGPSMGANSAWDLGYQGEGMSVAIIDTGLSYENQVFSIEPKDPNGVAFQKADIAAILAKSNLHAETLAQDVTVDSVYYSSKIPFGFNYADGLANFGTDDDTWMGHGTHVAGIVAGNMPEEAKEQLGMDTLGIAPEAQLVVMKVFDQNGACYFDYLIAALEDAILLGVDCANLSLGSPSGPLYVDGITEVYDAAYEAGINVVVSAGNDAFTGYRSNWGGNLVESSSVSTGTLGMPGTFDSVMTVASMDSDAELCFSQTCSWYNSDQKLRLYLEYTEYPNVPEGLGFQERLGGASYIYTDSFDQAEDKLVILPFEGGNADHIMEQAVAAKAAGVLIYDPTPDPNIDYSEFFIVDYSLSRFDVPFAGTSLGHVSFMQNYGHAPGDTLRVDAFWNASETAGKMSSFSSWGPTEGLTLKPEITGIGGNVFSAYMGNQFAVMSGTSMSSPAVAATATLVRQYLKEQGIEESQIPHIVNCLLMSTATPIVDAEHNTYYFVRRQGAGLANAANAIHSGAYIQVAGTNKAKLELGDDPDRTGVYTATFEVVNFSDSAKTYTLDTTVLGQIAQSGQIVAGEVTYLVYDYAQELSAGVTYNVENGAVLVPANSKATVSVTITLSDADKAYIEERFPYGSYVEGFIQLHSQTDVSLSVPFLGFYGAFGEGPVLEEGSYESLMGGDLAYTTADQFHNALWCDVPVYDDPGLDGLYKQKFYLGDTHCVLYNKVPAALCDPDTDGIALFRPENAGISPNGDGYLDVLQMGLGLKRNAENIHYTVTNRETGELLWEQDTGFVSKTYYSASVHGPVYAGLAEGSGLDLDWLYPVEHHINEESGYEWDEYDTSRCLLDEGTWVTIQADVQLEVTDKTQGIVNANHTVAFPLYIDVTSPKSNGKNCDLLWSETTDNQWEIDAGIVPPENYETNTLAYVRSSWDEQWFLDYVMEISLRYVDGRWFGMAMSGCMLNYVPGINYGFAQMGLGVTYREEAKFLMIGADYAGNSYAKEFYLDSRMQDYVSLEADRRILQVGDTLTIQDVQDNDFSTKLEWKLSNSNVAEIVATDDRSCTIRALACGKVTVQGGLGPVPNTVDIYVTDSTREEVANRFPDIQGHWAAEDVITAVQMGLTQGTSPHTFSPNQTVTRAQLVTLLYRLAGAPAATGNGGFRDVAEDRYYAPAVAWAAEQGIVHGRTAEIFAPHATATREEMAALFYRFAQNQGMDTSARADLSLYADAFGIRNYARDALSWAVATGLIQGMTAHTLNPQNTATRAQAVTVLIRYTNL